MRTRRRALLLDVGVSPPVGKGVGRAVDPPVHCCGWRRRCLQVVVGNVVERMKSGIQRAVNSLDHCNYLICVFIPCQGLCGPLASWRSCMLHVEVGGVVDAV